VNFAEIVADGAVGYGPGVSDDDSTPDGDITNDLLVDTDDVNIDQIPGDEDDHDRALLDPAKVRSDNPKSGTIPGTGSNTAPLLYLAAALAVLGALALLATRRRRQPA
jgi:LPXTG-motif cell wall-anchored protein